MTDTRTRDRPVVTDSGIEIAPVYRALEAPFALPDPGEFPYTRGIYPTMYRGRRWTMRQDAGAAPAVASHRRDRPLLRRGQTGVPVAFDLPAQFGLAFVRRRAAPATMSTAWHGGMGR